MGWQRAAPAIYLTYLEVIASDPWTVQKEDDYDDRLVFWVVDSAMGAPGCVAQCKRCARYKHPAYGTLTRHLKKILM